MNNIKSKTLYKNDIFTFYYCDCCEKFFLKHKDIAWKISPLRFSEFYQTINVINDSYSEGLKPNSNNFNYSNEIKSFLNLKEEEIELICDIFDSNIIEIKRIIFEMIFFKN